MDADYILNPPTIIEIPIEFLNDFTIPSKAKRALRDIMAYPGVDLENPLDLSIIKMLQDPRFDNPFDSRLGKFSHLICKHMKDLYGHFDLGKRKDPLCFCFCHVEKLVTIDKNTFPYIVIDFIGRIQPTSRKSIRLGVVKNIVKEIRDVGYYIRLLTFDNWQSYRLMEEIQEGWGDIIVTQYSMDHPRNWIKINYDHKEQLERVSHEGNLLAPYEMVANRIKEGLVRGPVFSVLDREVESIQVDPVKRKMVKAATDSADFGDDTIQCVVSAIYHCIMNTQIGRGLEDIPQEVKEKENKERDAFEDFLKGVQTSGIPQEVKDRVSEEWEDEIPNEDGWDFDNLNSNRYW